MKYFTTIGATVTFAILAASVAGNGSAATFTAVHTNGGEPSLFDILDGIYGAGNYERNSDDLDGLWIADDLIGATAVSKYSSANERLGICQLCDGADNVLLGATVTENGNLSETLFDGIFTFAGPSFRWYDAAFGAPVVGTVYSDASLNANGTDHMVSFAINSRPGVFVLAFEDWLSTDPMASDRDFNDFLVEVRFAPPLEGEIPAEAPEPTGIALLGGALLVLGLARRSRSKRV